MKIIFLLIVIALSAEAFAQTHSVDLSWTQGTCTSCTVTGNNVYRSTTSGGPYTQIKSFTVPTLAYTDGGLPQLTTYYYVTTAVDTTGESQNSNEVKATTLADAAKPSPPSNLTAVPH